LDIGANVGLYSINLARNFDSVCAIEPHPLNASLLRLNFEINQIKDFRIILKAAWDKKERLVLHQKYEENFADETITTSLDKRKENQFAYREVDGVPLDSYNFKPHFIKIDVDGAEMHTLKGLEKTLESEHPIVMVEVHKIFGITEKMVMDYMRSLDYLESAKVCGSKDVSHIFFWVGDMWNIEAMEKLGGLISAYRNKSDVPMQLQL
jgi:FkbM family methyltransferase